MSQIPHQRVDAGIGVLLAYMGQMQIDHSGLQLGMAQVLLDGAQIDAGLEQMGGIGMPPMSCTT